MKWVGVDDMMRNIDGYQQKAEEVVHQVLLYWAPQIEATAKQEAPWTDRTGNARQTLHSFVEKRRREWILYLSHGVEYGIDLEVDYGGNYAIIMDTIHQYAYRVMDMAKKAFRK